MKLYGNLNSTCTRKVLCTLAEKGKEAQFINVDLAKREQKSPEHLARQPFGVVPVLEDEDFQMYESRAIIRYLDDKFPTPKLTPTDIRGKARMEQFTSIEYSYFAPPAMKIVYQKMMNPMRGLPTDQAVLDQGKEGVTRCATVLEKALEGREFLAGDQFSLADIGYMPYVEYIFACGEGELITSHKNVGAWWKRISERPSWKKAVGK